ncbi:MAG: hypothetical protein JWP12_2121 [Bacteroidetes bacterium]|nr:hypothetical protein [Bacteroidota bacterium]
MDNLKLKGLDGKRINIHEHYEVISWCQAFGCTQEELKKAVAAVGTSAESVRKHLKK